MLKKIDLLFILETLEDAETEFEQIMLDTDWFVTETVDKITDAKARVHEALEEIRL